MGIEDYITDDHDELDAKFDQMLIESQDESKEKDMIIAEQERNIELYEKQSASLTRMVEGTQSLLTEQTEKLILSLKKRKNDKQAIYDFKQEQVNKFENKSKKRSDICTWILRILFAISLICVIYFVMPLIDSLENWHSEHELLYDLFKWILSLLIAFLGLRLEVFDTLFKWKSKKVIVLLGKMKLMKNYGKQIDTLNDEMVILLQEMNQIQDEIDNELQNNIGQG